MYICDDIKESETSMVAEIIPQIEMDVRMIGEKSKIKKLAKGLPNSSVMTIIDDSSVIC